MNKKIKRAILATENREVRKAHIRLQRLVLLGGDLTTEEWESLLDDADTMAGVFGNLAEAIREEVGLRQAT